MLAPIVVNIVLFHGFLNPGDRYMAVFSSATHYLNKPSPPGVCWRIQILGQWRLLWWLWVGGGIGTLWVPVVVSYACNGDHFAGEWHWAIHWVLVSSQCDARVVICWCWVLWCINHVFQTFSLDTVKLLQKWPMGVCLAIGIRNERDLCLGLP